MGLFNLFGKKKEDSVNDVVPEPKYKFKYVLIDEALLEEIIYFVAPGIYNFEEGNQIIDLGLVYGIQEEKTGVFFSFSKRHTLKEEPRFKTWFIMKADNVMYHVNYRGNHYNNPTEFVYEVPEPYLELAKEAFAFWISGKGYSDFSKECINNGLLSESPIVANNKRRMELSSYIREVNEKLMAESEAGEKNSGGAMELPASEIVETANGLSLVEHGKMAIERLERETKIPFIRIRTLKNQPSITESKIGGLPYLPANEALPVDKDGKPMRLLAQINCKDLVDLEEYPNEGMLQFYMTTNWPWEESVVKYYETIDSSITYEAVADRLTGVDMSNESFPVNGEFGMEFSLSEESMSRDDNRLLALFCQYFTEISGTWISVPEDGGDDVYELFEAYCDDSYAGGHKVGGYHSSAQLPDYYSYNQDDKTIDVKADDSPMLLFQMDSEFGGSIMWGDLGVARFFIKRSDLKARNFENAYMVWDCS